MASLALAVDLPMLGGADFYITTSGHKVRAHYWAARQSAHDADDQNFSSASLAGDNVMIAGATIVILPGFTEFCEKYSRDILRLHQWGHNVLIIDWPGQGLSGHLGRSALAVHCDDFADYLDALDAVIETIGLGGENLILFGHSMGGHLALRYAKRRPSQIIGVILSAPMMAPPIMPVWLIRALSGLLVNFGLCYAFPPFYRVTSLDLLRDFQPENPLTRYPEGYESQFIWFDDMPELRRGGPTIGWVNAAYRSTAHYTLNREWLMSVRAPVLALVAGDERVVSSSAIDYALSLIPNVERHDFVGARHELLHELPEVTEKLWEHVSSFIEKARCDSAD